MVGESGQKKNGSPRETEKEKRYSVMGKEEYAVTSEELMSRYAAGNESALDELYRNNVGLIKKTA